MHSSVARIPIGDRRDAPSAHFSQNPFSAKSVFCITGKHKGRRKIKKVQNKKQSESVSEPRSAFFI